MVHSLQFGIQNGNGIQPAIEYIALLKNNVFREEWHVEYGPLYYTPKR